MKRPPLSGENFGASIVGRNEAIKEVIFVVKSLVLGGSRVGSCRGRAWRHGLLVGLSLLALALLLK